jgi:ribosomal protein L12E/L44/L45/RPP1/RPP2
MEYIVNYSRWKTLYEEAESVNSVGLKVSEIWSKISNKLKKKYGKEPEEVLNDAKAGMAAAASAAIDLPDQPAQPEVPANVAHVESKSDISERLNESMDWEYWIDVAVDVLGGILDGIPLGVTQIASMVVDILHTISYALRYFFASDENSKIKYLIMTCLGAAGAFMPLGGNMLNLTVMKKIDKILQFSPGAISKLGYGAIGKKLPFPHWTTFTKWKVKFVYVFIKMLGNAAQDIIEKISSFFSKMFDGLLIYLKSWVKSSPLTGWIISDYVLPVIDKIKSAVSGFDKISGIAELAKG